MLAPVTDGDPAGLVGNVGSGPFAHGDLLQSVKRGGRSVCYDYTERAPRFHIPEVTQLTETDRPLRADAARNRARVLEVAYDTFAADGLSVPIDEIARRAGVGAGTVYRHFPTKEDLYRAVVEDRIQRIVERGARPAGLPTTPRRCSSSCARWCCNGAPPTAASPTRSPGIGIDIKTAMPAAEEAFLGILGELLEAAQAAGTARGDVDVADVKAILAGCLALQAAKPEAADRLTEVVLDGLRRP